MSLPDQKLVKWLEETGKDITGAGPFVRLELLKAVDGSPPQLMQTIPFSEEAGANPDISAMQIWELAEQEVATLYGVHHRFIILAFRNDTDEYERRFPFKITKNRTTDNQLDGESVPPTETGFTAQMLRHDSETHRLNMLLSGAHAERSESTIARLSNDLDRLQERHMKVLLLQEELLDRKAQRDLNFSVELQKAKRSDELKGMVLGFAPLLFAKLSGGRMINQTPIATFARDMAVGKILKNLSPEEVGKVMNGLKSENKVAFWELYQSYGTDDAAEQAQKPEPLRDAPTPDPTGAN